jgi:hypothetical protein
MNVPALLSGLRPIVVAERSSRSLSDQAREERTQWLFRTELAARKAAADGRWKDAVRLTSDFRILASDEHDEEARRAEDLGKLLDGDLNEELRPGQEKRGCSLTSDGSLSCDGKTLATELRVPPPEIDGDAERAPPDYVSLMQRSPSGRYLVFATCDSRCDWYYQADLSNGSLRSLPMPIHMYGVLWPPDEDFVIGLHHDEGSEWISVAGANLQARSNPLLDVLAGCSASSLHPATATWSGDTRVVIQAEFTCCPEGRTSCATEEYGRLHFAPLEFDARTAKVRVMD